MNAANFKYLIDKDAELTKRNREIYEKIGSIESAKSKQQIYEIRSKKFR